MRGMQEDERRVTAIDRHGHLWVVLLDNDAVIAVLRAELRRHKANLYWSAGHGNRSVVACVNTRLDLLQEFAEQPVRLGLDAQCSGRFSAARVGSHGK